MIIKVFLPCRAGSQRVKNKNIRKFNMYKFGLIELKIKQLLKVKQINEIILSTDDNKIIKFIKHFKNKKIKLDIRPKKLATDKASTFSVLKHAIDYFKKKKIKFEYLLLLEPTSPLRDYRDIEFCINKIINNDIETIVSVSKVKAQHPNFLFKINKKNILRPYLNNNFKSTMRRQDIQPLYFLEGSLYISKISV